jgi:TonB-dependent receptor
MNNKPHHLYAAASRLCSALSFIFALFCPASIRAAEATGVVAGQVFNQTTGKLLEGATIKAEGTSHFTASERGGEFSLSLPSGRYTLVVDYTGLNTVRIPVVVSAGETITQRIALTSDIYKLEPYTVTGQREGNAMAIELQRLADNVKTVVSTDAFGNPAANPGELLQRLPGVSVELQAGEVRNFLVRGFTSDWTTLMIDGAPMATSEGSVSSRQVQIAQIGTNNLESIELIKAPLPDMDANAVGGYVNVRTKRAFDRAPGRVINVSAGTRWTYFKSDNIRGKDEPKFDQFAFSYSDVYSVLGGKNNLGVFFTTSYRSSPLLLDEANTLSISYLNHFVQPTATNGLTAPLQRQWGAGVLFYPDTEATNVGLNIDYKLGPNTYVYIKNTLNRNDNTSRDSGINRFTLSSLFATTAASFAPGSTYDNPEVLPVGNSTAQQQVQFQQRRLHGYAFATGIEHKMPTSGSKLNVDLNYSIARSGYPNLTNIFANFVDKIGWKLDRRGGTDEFHPLFTQTAGPSIYDPANYTPTTGFHQVYKIPNEVMGIRTDYRKDLSLLGNPAYLKVGGKLHQDVRKYLNHPVYFTWNGPKGVGNFLAPQYKLGDNLYGPFPFVQGPFSGLKGDPFADMSLWRKSANDAYLDAYYAAGALDSKLTEKISATYIMGSVQLRKLRIVPGIRFEHTDVSAMGHPKDQTASWGGNYVATLSNEENAARARRAVLPAGTWTSTYTKAHPGIHLIYEPFNKLLVRASYNKSITRPPISTLIPSGISVNEETQTIVAANPNLKPYLSDNFELKVERYFEPVGSFEVGVFLKEIDDYFRTIQTFVPEGANNGFDGLYAGYKLNQAVNIGKARYRGFEFNYQQQFSFLPGFWRGFGLAANYTYTQAEGDFGGVTYLKRLAGVRPRFGNVALAYVGHGLDVRLLANYQGKYYRGGAGATTIWGNSQMMLDLKTQYRINRTYQVYFEASNLLDENVSSVVQEGGLPIYAQKQGVLFATGIKATF